MKAKTEFIKRSDSTQIYVRAILFLNR